MVSKAQFSNGVELTSRVPQQLTSLRQFLLGIPSILHPGADRQEHEALVVSADGHIHLVCPVTEIAQSREQVRIIRELSDWLSMLETAVRGPEQSAAVVVRKLLAYA